MAWSCSIGRLCPAEDPGDVVSDSAVYIRQLAEIGCQSAGLPHDVGLLVHCRQPVSLRRLGAPRPPGYCATPRPERAAAVIESGPIEGVCEEHGRLPIHT